MSIDLATIRRLYVSTLRVVYRPWRLAFGCLYFRFLGCVSCDDWLYKSLLYLVLFYFLTFHLLLCIFRGLESFVSICKSMCLIRLFIHFNFIVFVCRQTEGERSDLSWSARNKNFDGKLWFGGHDSISCVANAMEFRKVPYRPNRLNTSIIISYSSFFHQILVKSCHEHSNFFGLLAGIADIDGPIFALDNASDQGTLFHTEWAITPYTI